MANAERKGSSREDGVVIEETKVGGEVKLDDVRVASRESAAMA